MSKVSRRTFLLSLGALCALGGAGPLASLASPGKPGPKLQKRTYTRLHMGTYVTVTACHESRLMLDEAIEKAFSALSHAEPVFTRHSAASPLGVLNAQGVLRDTPPELTALLRTSLQFARQTELAFNPASAPVLAALEAYKVASLSELPRSVAAALLRETDPRGIVVDGNTVRLKHSGMGVSLDGIAKGHIVDQVGRNLEEHGVTAYMVNAGGDIRVGPGLPEGRPWNVGIQDATSPARNITAVPLRSGALATSGNYESLAARGYNHLVATLPHSFSETRSACTSVSVTAPTCTEADALATALFVMDIPRGMDFIRRNPAYACLWQTAKGMIASPNWKGAAA